LHSAGVRGIFNANESLFLWHGLGVVLKVSVIVPAFNEEKLIAASLDSIRGAMTAFQERGWESELIVCDNNSTDRTAELARAAGATVVFEPVNQIGRARNKGAEAATGDWLIFVDADSHPSRELMGDVADAVATSRFLFGGSTVTMEGARGLPRMLVGFWNGISRLGKYAAGSFIFCETAAFQKIGGFDNRFYASEEIDLSRRLKRLARQTGRRAVILHRHPMVTSARKLHLYSNGEHLRFLLRTVLGMGRALRNREACHTWYDGRR
jgi:GT2 family glycosyltransferase